MSVKLIKKIAEEDKIRKLADVNLDAPNQNPEEFAHKIYEKILDGLDWNEILTSAEV